MSLRATSWVLGHSEVQNSLRLVLTVLAFATDTAGTGRMRPSTLAKQAGIPLHFVEEALKLLVARAQVEYEWKTNWDGQRARTFTFRVLFPEDYKPDLTGEGLR